MSSQAMERAAMVGVKLKGTDPGEYGASLDELRRLLETAGARVEFTAVQERARRDPATLVGPGKVREIAEAARREGWSLVAFNEDLTPTQGRNLQEEIPAKVVDRTRLILDIFAQRARTREGKLQVELAQLQYLLPRVTERFGRFEQQTGGIGTRGPGERKLEVTQRRIRDRISRLRGEMDAVRRQRDLQRENRRRIPLPIVAVVGYTNAGKSTLVNALKSRGSAAVHADDRLFATLDPSARRVRLPGGRTALFVDTVGFIQRLPHHLVAAFRATFEEARDADLLLHLVDASHSDAASQRAVVEKVLADLGADELPRVTALNKADLLSPGARAAYRRAGERMVSARTGEGLENLLGEVARRLDEGAREEELLVPHQRRDLVALLHGAGRVLSETVEAGGARLRVRLDEKNWGRVRKELARS